MRARQKLGTIKLMERNPAGSKVSKMTNVKDDGTTTDSPTSAVFGQPYLSVAAVAKRIAVAPATLRTWDRRYGLGPSMHQTGAHRRYSHDDVLRLSLMRLWIFRGATSAQAASYALAADLSEIDSRQLEQDLQAEILKSAEGTPNEQESKIKVIEPVRHATVTSINHLRVANEAPTNPWQARCADVVSAALRGDYDACSAALWVGPNADLIQWWKRLVRPALERIASHTVLATPGQSPKMLVFRIVLEQLQRITRDDSGVPAGHPSKLRDMVLVFAPDSERLSLSAHVLAAALVGVNVNGHLVSGPESHERIVELVAMARPVAAVFVADQRPPDTDLLEQLISHYPQLPIFIGLGGSEPLAPSLQVPQVSRIRSFAALFNEIVAIANNPTFGSDYWEDQSRLVSLEHLR